MYSNGTAPKTYNGTAPAADIMPHSEEAETAVLGSILIDPDAFYEVDLIVNHDDFYSTQNGRIYKVMQDLHAAKFPVDQLTVCEMLEKRYGDGLEDFIIGLVTAVPTSINASTYARMVSADSMRRRLIHAGRKITNDATNGKHSVDKLVGDSEKVLFEVTQKSATKNVIPIKRGVSDVLDTIMRRVDAGGEITGIKTGWVDVDRILEGIDRDDFVVLAARPGMGKSLMESNMAIHCAGKGKRVARFNLEMGMESIINRGLSSLSRIEFKKIRRGQLTPYELQEVNKAAGIISELPMWIDDTAWLTLSQLTAKARRLHAEHGLDLITVDYLTLIGVESGYGNRTQDVGEISRGLKRLAKDLHVPVLSLAQLSRQCEQRNDKRPMLSDLRDSGEIEQDADIVMFLYRDEYYNPETTDRPNIVEVNIAKHRNGPTGTADLYYSRNIMSFRNLKSETQL